MLDVKENIWDFPKRVVICITTNGIIKKNGELVMGKGIALQAKQRFPKLPLILGQYIKQKGNQLYYISEYNIASFPTKHHWKDKSDIDLIQQSCFQLENFVKTYDKYAALPRPGCENGGLNWYQNVKPTIEHILSDRVCVVSL
jgi:hypothetical protein